MTAEKVKRNLSAWVPEGYFNKVKSFIKKENARPENLGIKMKIREFIIKSVDEFMKKRGG